MALFTFLIFFAHVVHEIFLVQSERIFRANGLELPPGLLVELLDLLFAFGPLYQWAVGVLVGVEDLNDELDPWSDFSRLDQVRRDARIIQKEEYLQNERHHVHLVGVLSVGADGGEQLLELGKEAFG